jgi:hypothetical protein
VEPLFAQGDQLIERVADVPPSGTIVQSRQGRPRCSRKVRFPVIAHAFYDGVTMFRDDRFFARLEHDEHMPLSLPQGTYRIRRQREVEPRDARIVVD